MADSTFLGQSSGQVAVFDILRATLTLCDRRILDLGTFVYILDGCKAIRAFYLRALTLMFVSLPSSPGGSETIS